MTNLLQKLKENSINYTENEPMKNHTTFKIGGNADLFIRVENIKQLKFLLVYFNQVKNPYMVFGKGSNLLVSDKGITGAVLYLEGDFNNISVQDNIITCGSGVSLVTLCRTALDNSLSGLEFAYGIPGSVGGAVFMNAGAYGGEMKTVITKATSIDYNGNIKEYNHDELELEYRKSVFKRNKEIILSAEFQMENKPFDEIKSKMDDFMNRRKEKQPLEYPSAGSTFKRPVGNFAGTLIEQCGLKGMSVGGAEVSTKHAGFIVNKGDATCNDVVALIKNVQNIVSEKTGYHLDTEVIRIGR